MNFCQKEFDLDKTRSFYDLLKTWKSYFLEIDPCRWSQGRHAQSCDVDSGTCDFRRDSSIVHTKCSLQALVQITKLNLQRKNKWDQSSLKSRVPESTSQLIPNQGKTGASGGPKWRQIWTFSKLIKKIAFCLNQNFFRRISLGVYRNRYENKRIWTLRAL